MSRRESSLFRAEKIGFVFQSYQLLPELTVLENVMLSGMLCGLSKKKAKEKSLDLLEVVGLADRIKHHPNEMSGGEQARVAIGRALAHSPKLLLADEPTSELDSATSFAVVKLLRELVDNEGLTVIMTTHDVNIMDIADNVYTMEDGRITDVREVKESC
jgi:ABC-type lipoprotein export system ATPase subunit